MWRLDEAHPCVLKWTRVPRRRHDYAVESGNGSTYMNIINRWKNEKFTPAGLCVCVCRSFLNKAHPFHPVYWLLSFVMGIKTCYFYLSWEDPLEHLSPLRDSVRWIFEFINLDDGVFFSRMDGILIHNAGSREWKEGNQCFILFTWFSLMMISSSRPRPVEVALAAPRLRISTQL